MTEPYKYQKQGVLQIEKFGGRAVLADEMGLGKTLQALWWIKRSGFPLTIIICPAFLKWHWKDQALLHTRLQSEVIEGIKPPRSIFQGMIKPAPLLIVNYEILTYWVDKLIKLKPTAMVLDECHRPKNPSAKQTKACLKLARKVPHVLGMSGTPIENCPIEFWPVLNMVAPQVFPDRWKYAWRYCAPKLNGFGGWDVRGSSRTKELHAKLKKTCMIRRLTKDVLPDLKDHRSEVTRVPIDMGEYNRVQSDFKNWLLENQYDRAKKALALTKVGYLLRTAAESKLPTIFNWIESYLEESDRKLVIFGVHRKVLEPIFSKYKAESVLITGKTGTKKRHDGLKLFHTNKKKRLVVANCKAGGLGLDMTAANRMLFVELPWNPGVLDQAIKRCHRIGQKKELLITYLVAMNTIEENQCRILRRKQNKVNQVLDGGSRVDNLSILNELIKEVF